ncbi:MAG: PCRF domain-containing protein, partial [Bacilli bacterium]
MKNYGGYFEVDQKLKKILEINEKVSAVDFWEDKISAQKEIAFLNSLKEDTEDLIELKNKVDDYLILESSISEEEFHELLKEEINNLEDKIIKINNLSLLNEENDTKDVVLEIHAGA